MGGTNQLGPVDFRENFPELGAREIENCCVGARLRYVFTALHRSEADLETNKTSGFYEGTEIAVDQLVEHVIGIKSVAAV